MKRLIGLIIYTAVIIGGSYLFQGARYLPTILYVGIIVVGIGIVALLNPGASTTLNPNVDLNYKTSQEKWIEKKEKQNRIDYLSILTYVYLLVPFFLAIAWFV